MKGKKMFRKSTWLLLVCGLLVAGCPMAGGGGGNDNGNDNGNHNSNDNGNNNGNDNGGGGELPEGTEFSALLDGAQETPPVVTDAMGQGTATLSDDQLQLVVQVTASGLSGPVVAAHIHNGPAGVAGDVLFNLTDAVVEENGIVTINTTITLGELTPDFSTVMALFLDRLYFNLHTEDFPDGEIRGQILAADDDDGTDNGELPQSLVALFEATLDGEQEMPPVASSGTGTGSVGVTANDEFVVQVMASELTGPVTAAHIHMGAPGVAGDVVLNLTPHITESDGMVRIDATVSENDFSLQEGMSALEALRSGNLYFNLHTALNPAGEIRGQLLESDVTSDDGGNGAG